MNHTCAHCGATVDDEDLISLTRARLGQVMCRWCYLDTKPSKNAKRTIAIFDGASYEEFHDKDGNVRYRPLQSIFGGLPPDPPEPPDPDELFQLLVELDQREEPMEQDLTTRYDITIMASAVGNAEHHRHREELALLRSLSGTFGDRVSVRRASGEEISTDDGKTIDVAATSKHVDIVEADPVPQDIEITPIAARQVLWHFQDELSDWSKPGAFICLLLDTISRADAVNRAKLKLVYPEYVEAITLGEYYLDGVDKLREIANGS